MKSARNLHSHSVGDGEPRVCSALLKSDGRRKLWGSSGGPGQQRPSSVVSGKTDVVGCLFIVN